MSKMIGDVTLVLRIVCPTGGMIQTPRGPDFIFKFLRAMEFTDQANGESGAGDRPKIMRQGYPVPAELIGFIIGKGGANIDQIQRASSAKLSTKDETALIRSSEWVYIQIEGSGITGVAAELTGHSPFP